MKKKILIITLTLLLMPISVLAKSQTKCDYALVSTMKQFASNVNVIYDYYLKDSNAYFNVTINNITPDMYILDEVTGSKYYYDSTNNGELVIPNYSNVEILKYKIYSNNAECIDEPLMSKYINLPVYNKYNADPLCEGIEDFKLCQRFLKTNVKYEDFKNQIEDYKKVEEKEEEVIEKKKIVEKTDMDKIIEILSKYYILIIAIIVAIISLIIIKFRKRDKFDFKL